MASTPLALPRSPEERIAAIFRHADHEVQQAVGLEPGTVDWFATPRSGFVRPRTYFCVMPAPPESIETTLVELEAARAARGADRAMAIVMAGTLPSGYAPDLHHRIANVLTFRRWLLEISGVAEEARSFAQAHSSTFYLPRRARLSSGEEVQVEPYIDAWAERRERPTLIVEGPPLGGKTFVIRHAVERAATRFARDPESTTPFTSLAGLSASDLGSSSSPRSVALDEGFLIPALRDGRPGLAYDVAASGRWHGLFEANHDGSFADFGVDAIRLELLPPSHDEINRWVREQLDAGDLSGMFERARLHHPEFRALSNALANLSRLLKAMQSHASRSDLAAVERWIAAVVTEYATPIAEAIERMSGALVAPNMLLLLEERALQEFALALPLDAGNNAIFALRFSLSNLPKGVLTWFNVETVRFSNELIRDYFVARKVAREVEAGNVEILLRYQFRSFVFLFLANLAPELAAKMTEGRFARLEEKMQEEVERKLQLTFAHLLNRPVGMIHAHLNEIREGIGKEKAAELARPFAKLMAEVDYINSLAERTRLWQSKPEEPIEAVHLRPLVNEVARSLGGRHAAVALLVEVPPELYVHAMREALRELLQCLLENAFHAAPTGEPDHTPRVTVSTRPIGEILRVEVRDNGAGVSPEDRERIFEPLITTKKGGTGKPRGTGLGLPIARRYAECMGGRVGFDAEREETCFFVDLVPWRDDA
jgi:signal transduction histidine kinase